MVFIVFLLFQSPLSWNADLSEIFYHNIISLSSFLIDIVNDYSNYNMVLTAFDIKQRYFNQLLKKQNATVKYQKEALTQVNPQLHEWLSTVNASASTDSISENGENVKTDVKNSSENDLDAPYESEITRHKREIEETNRVYEHRDPARQRFYADLYEFKKALEAKGELEGHKIMNVRTDTERSGIVYGASQTDIDIAVRLSKVLGRDIMFFGEQSRNGNIKNGTLDRETIWINVHRQAGKTVLWVVAHELTHSIEDTRAYGCLKDYIFKKLSPEEIKALREELKKSYDKKEIDFEIVCNYIADNLLTSEKAITDLVSHNRTLGEKIRSIINKIGAKLKIAKAKEALDVDNMRNIYERALAEQSGELENTDGYESELDRNREKAAEPDDILNDRYIKKLREDFDAGEISKDEYEALVDEYLEEIEKSETRRESTPKHSKSKVSNNSNNGESTHIKEQIRANIKEILKLDAVADVKAPLDQLTTAKQTKEWIYATLAPTGYHIDRQGYGTITFDKKELNFGIDYIKTPYEAAALAALPKVLKRGKIIESHNNHKNRGVSTITIAAPITINGNDVVMGVAVKQTNRSYYKAHRVLMSDGTEISLTKENTSAKPERGAASNEALIANPITDVSNNIITDSKQKSNTLDENIFPFSDEAQNSYGSMEELSEKVGEEYEAVTKEMNPKGREYLASAERAFVNRLSEIFSLPTKAKRGLAKDIAKSIVLEQFKNGAVTVDFANDLFEKAFDAGVIADDSSSRDWIRNDFNELIGEFTKNIDYGKNYVEEVARRMAEEELVIPSAESLFETYKQIKSLRAIATRAVAKNILLPIEQSLVKDLLMTDHIDIRELDIVDDPKVYLAITIHLKLNGYALKYSIKYLKNINTGEKQKASHSKNDLLNGGGEGEI